MAQGGKAAETLRGPVHPVFSHTIFIPSEKMHPGYTLNAKYSPTFSRTSKTCILSRIGAQISTNLVTLPCPRPSLVRSWRWRRKTNTTKKGSLKEKWVLTGMWLWNSYWKYKVGVIVRIKTEFGSGIGWSWIYTVRFRPILDLNWAKANNSKQSFWSNVVNN